MATRRAHEVVEMDNLISNEDDGDGDQNQNIASINHLDSDVNFENDVNNDPGLTEEERDNDGNGDDAYFVKDDEKLMGSDSEERWWVAKTSNQWHKHNDNEEWMKINDKK